MEDSGIKIDFGKFKACYDAFFNYGLTSPTSREELRWLFFVVSLRCRIRQNPLVVELGTMNGMGALVMAAAIRSQGDNGKVIAIDNYDAGQHATAQEAARHFDLSDKIEFWRGDDIECCSKFADESIEILFVDSDHRYPHVASVLEAYMPKVVPRGIIAGHDYTFAEPGVVRAVDEWRQRNTNNLIGTTAHLTIWWSLKCQR